jgi:hypothetical protein
MARNQADVERYAAAELYLSESAGLIIRLAIEQAESMYGVSIRELRILMDRAQPVAGRSGINCTVVA